ncbi:MAG: hypothetical protein ACWIPI_06775, partial [Polaribacter sp.]
MKNILLLTLLLVFCTVATAQVGVGTETPDKSAVLDVTSTDKGFLPPRLSFDQIKAISTPPAGLIIYCTDCSPKGIYIYNNSIYTDGNYKHLPTGSTLDIPVASDSFDGIPFIILSISADGYRHKKTTKVEYTKATYGLDPGLDVGAFIDGERWLSIDTRLVKGTGIDSRGDDFDSRIIDFTIQSLPFSALGTVVPVPLSVGAPAGRQLTFSAKLTRIPEGVDVYLEDVVEKTYTKLTDDASYKVTLATKIKGPGRFYLYTPFSSSSSSTQVSIGTTSLEDSAALNIYSTTKGMLIPRMTKAKISKIVAPSEGLMVYCTDLKSLYVYNGTVFI